MSMIVATVEHLATAIECLTRAAAWSRNAARMGAG